MEPDPLPDYDNHAMARARRNAFATVAFLETCHQFGFYGLQGTFVVFCVAGMRLSPAHATLLWGAFGSLVYTIPSTGGWLGDRILGTRHTIALSLLLFAAGYTILAALPTGSFWSYGCLALMALASGFFRPNAASLVRKIYNRSQSKLDVIFTVYYMSLNIGAIAALMIIPVTELAFGWKTGFALAAVVMWAGFAWAVVTCSEPGGSVSQAPRHPVVSRAVTGKVVLGLGLAVAAFTVFLLVPAVARICVWLAVAAVIAIWVVVFRRAGRGERQGLVLAYLLQLEAALFFVFNQQVGTSLTGFVAHDVSGQFSLFGHALFYWQPGQFQSLNSIWIMVVAPVLALAYRRAEVSGKAIPIYLKFSAGFVCLAISFLICRHAATLSTNGLVSPWLMVAAYAAFSTGELLISALGLAAIARYVPSGTTGVMMGGYLTLAGISTYVGSVFAASAAGSSAYSSLFLGLALLACLGATLSALLSPVARGLERNWRRQPLPSSA